MTKAQAIGDHSAKILTRFASTAGAKKQVVVDQLNKAIKQITAISAMLPLTEDTQSYDFDLVAASSTEDNATGSNRLLSSDLLAAMGLRLAIVRVPVKIVSGVVKKVLFGNAEQPMCYVDDNMHTDPNERKALRRVFNGRLSMTVDQTEVIPRIPTELLQYIPQQQFFAQTGSNRGFKAQTGGSDAISDNGYFPLSSPVTLIGQKENKVRITFAEGVSTSIDGSINDTATDGFRNYLQVSFIGTVVKKGAQAALAIDKAE